MQWIISFSKDKVLCMFNAPQFFLLGIRLLKINDAFKLFVLLGMVLDTT